MKTVLMMLLGVCLGGGLWAQTLNVTLAPTEVYVGSAFKLTFSADEPLAQATFTFDKEVQQLSQSSSLSNINGHVTSSLTYLIAPHAEGPLQLTACSAVTRSGKTLTTSARPKVVVKAITPDPDLQLTLSIDREEVMPGDEFTLSLEVRAKSLAVNGQVLSPFLEQSFFGGVEERPPRVTYDFNPADDAPIELIKNPELVVNNEKSDGASRWVYAFRYRARHEGSFHFPAPVLHDTRVKIADRTLRQEPCAAIGKPLFLEIITPPLVGRPVNYTGALATTFSASAHLNTLKAKTGDPIQLIITLTSDGDPTLLRPPHLPELDGFRTYGAPSRESREAGCSYTYALRPLRDGLLEIPSITLGWYNRSTKAYETVSTSSIPLRVLPSAQLILLGDGDLESTLFPPPLQLEKSAPHTLTPSTGAWCTLLLGVMAVIIRWILVPLWKYLLRPLFSKRRARRPVARALRQLQTTTRPDEALLAVRQALKCPALTAAELRTRFDDDVSGEEAYQAFDTLQRAAYTTGEDHPHARQTLLRLLPALLAKTLPLLFLLFAVTCHGDVSRHSDAETEAMAATPSLLTPHSSLLNATTQIRPASESFLYRQALATTLNATAPEAYAEASQLWERVAISEGSTASLLLNAATCAILAGDVARATQILKEQESTFGRSADSDQLWALLANQTETPVPQWPSRPLLSANARLNYTLYALGLFLLLLALGRTWHFTKRTKSER